MVNTISRFRAKKRCYKKYICIYYIENKNRRKSTKKYNKKLMSNELRAREHVLQQSCAKNTFGKNGLSLNPFVKRVGTFIGAEHTPRSSTNLVHCQEQNRQKAVR